MQALEYHQRALKILLTVYGEEHPNTASSLNNIGLVYRAKGDHVQALEYHQRALKIAQKVLGSAHPTLANNIRAINAAPTTAPFKKKHGKGVSILAVPTTPPTKDAIPIADAAMAALLLEEENIAQCKCKSKDGKCKCGKSVAGKKFKKQ